MKNGEGAAMIDERMEHEAWPARALILAGLGALFGLILDWLLDPIHDWSREPFRLSAATFVAGAGLLFAFTLEKMRWKWSAAFALAGAAVAAGIVYWNGGPEDWRFAALLLALAIAAPLFQVVRDEGRWNLAQRPIHAHAWTDVVLWCAAWLFVLIVVLLIWLLAALFRLIGIQLLWELVREGWFMWMLCGASLGAAAGLLRDRDRVLNLLQRVVTVVLSVLTPFLALGLGLFILSLPFTGLEPLWEQTKSTTPIVLACAGVAAVFVNATLGNSSEEEASHPLLRWGALVLALVVLPLAVVAVISTWLRIDQYGFTPDRLWAVTTVLVALAYGLAYLAAPLLGRARWPERIRQHNVRLALALCGLALLLATPLVDFGAISTRDQVARLDRGEVAPEKFDWRALAFDFGPSGREALERLQLTGKTAGIRKEAQAALAADDRWAMAAPAQRAEQADAIAKARILPRQTELPLGLRRGLMENNGCRGRDCTVYYEAGSDRAVALAEPTCWDTTHRDLSGAAKPGVSCNAGVTVFYREGEEWTTERRSDLPGTKQSVEDGWKRGLIEVREVDRRQVYVGGQPVGEPFD